MASTGKSVLLISLVALFLRPDPALSQGSRIVSGQAPFQYEYDPSRLVLPSSVKLENGHGLAVDKDGFIYFTYQSSSVDQSTRALIRFNPDGSDAVLLGDDNTLAAGTPHGLRISYEGGEGFLYHSNNAATVYKTHLNGSLVWKRDETSLWKNTPYWPFAPTNSVVPPEGADNRELWVTDGYGKAFVHELSNDDGAYLNFSFGGAGNTTSPPKFETPHGINYDPRFKSLVLADRVNHRLMYVGFDGSYKFHTPMPDSVSLPCNVNFASDGVHAIVPNLGSYTNLGQNANGTVAVLDGSNSIVSVIEVAKLLGNQGHQHPHDAIFLPNGDIVVCCWYPGTISYWRRVSQ